MQLFGWSKTVDIADFRLPSWIWKEKMKKNRKDSQGKEGGGSGWKGEEKKAYDLSNTSSLYGSW